MKIRGKKLEFGPASELIVFPRGETEVAFRVTAVLDRKEFEKHCPMPKPPMKRIKGGQMVEDADSPKHIAAMGQHNQNYMDWLFLSSLSVPAEKEGEPDEPIEWEKIDLHKRSTWHLWDDELQEAGFSDMERKRIFMAVTAVNSLSDARLDEARKSFLQRQREEPEASSSQTDEPIDTQSGELANEQESDSQESQLVGTISMSDSTGGQSPA